MTKLLSGTSPRLPSQTQPFTAVCTTIISKQLSQKNSVFNLKKLGEHTEKNLFRENGVVICIIKGQHGHTTCKSIVFYYYYIIIFF